MSVNSIVQVLVSQIVAPTPATLQETGAFVSQGGTINGAGSSVFLSQYSDLLPYLQTPGAVTSLVVSTTTATVTTVNPHGLPSGQSLNVNLIGFAPANLNGEWLATVTGASTFTFTVPSGYVTATTEGTWTTQSAFELAQMATTFFGQGSNTGVYVLELGAQSDNNAIAALSTYIANNLNSNYVPGAVGYYYAYLVPRSWDGNTNYLNLIASYESTTSRTYFFTTTTLANYVLYTDLMKDVWALIESPAIGTWVTDSIASATHSATQVVLTMSSNHGVAVGQWFLITGCTPTAYNGWHQAVPGTSGTALAYNVLSDPGPLTVDGSLVVSQYPNAGVASTEFTCAAPFFRVLSYSPSTTNKVPPFEYGFVYGVTPFPSNGYQSLMDTLKLSHTNIIGTGAEGGISNTIILWGQTEDGNDLTYWYSVDWVQINLDLDTANEVINGSNDRINPLYFNQPGIDRIQARGANTMTRGVTFGMVLGDVIQTALDGPALGQALDAGTYAGKTVLNAVPFINYVTENPSDYKIGKYAGYTVVYTPLRGFDQIIYVVDVTELIATA